ncbi:MAG TPA: hypothetical protein EYQ50_22385 [Verrucomicrobiales bacterium]|nr:hypothetical protein [Verrucomicrobiales bacterium]
MTHFLYNRLTNIAEGHYRTISGRCVAFILTLMTLSAANAAAFQAEDLFRPDHLLDIQITLPDGDWEELRKQRRARDFRTMFSNTGAKPYTQFKADISIDGVIIPSVAVRKKGFIGSVDEERPSLKVKFDAYVDQNPIKGLDRLTLNNNKQDESLASQFLTYKFFNQAGLPAPRVSFAKVTVNGEYLGIYSNVESVRGPFLKNHYGDNSGEFYEGTIADFYPKALDSLEAKNKRTEKDKTRAIRLAQLLESEESFDLEELGRVVNVEKFIRFWAIESLIGFWDGYSNNQNNYFAYSNPEDNARFHFIPWGADGAFSDMLGPFGRFGGGKDAPKSVYSQSMLTHRLYQTEGIPDQYKNTLEDLLKNVWNESEIIRELNRIRVLTQNHLHRRQNRIEDGSEKIIRFVKNRRSEIESELKRWPVTVDPEPRKPQYTVKIGEAKGSFETVWTNERVGDVKGKGKTVVECWINDSKVSFSSLGVLAQPEEPPRSRFGRRGGRGRSGARPEPKATLTWMGTQQGDGKKLTMVFTLAKDLFKATPEDGVVIDGMFVVSEPGEERFNFFLRKQVKGKLFLKSAGLKENAPVVGHFEVQIQETKGGMMSRMRGGGRGGRPPGRGGPPGREGPFGGERP